jgi:membrane protein YqaA with SNARE-associated domain
VTRAPDGDASGGAAQQSQRGEKGCLQTYWRLSFIALSLAISVLIVLCRDRLAQFAGYGYPSVFVVSFLGNATIFMPAPSLAFVFAMGSVLNPLWVGLVAGAGEALGELTGYLAGYGGQPVVERYDVYQRLRGYMERYGLIVIFVLSAVPNPFFDLAGLAAGALRVPVWQFLLVCWLGKTLKCIFFAFLGASSAHILDEWLL